MAPFRAWDEESFQQTASKVPNDTPSQSGEQPLAGSNPVAQGRKLFGLSVIEDTYQAQIAL